MAALVTLDVAKKQLRVSEDEHYDDELIDRLIEDASGMVLVYLKSQADATWDVDTVPGAVRAAVLMLVEHTYSPRYSIEQVWGAIELTLRMYRDPALA